MLRSKNEHVSYNVFESMKFNNEESQGYKTDVVEDLLRILLNKTMVNSIIPRNLMSEDEDCVLDWKHLKLTTVDKRKKWLTSCRL